MKKYKVGLGSRVSFEVFAESEEEAQTMVTEGENFGEKLLDNAEISDIELIDDEVEE